MEFTNFHMKIVPVVYCKKVKLIVVSLALKITATYFCHQLSDNYVVLSDLYVDLSDLYVDLSDHYVDLLENYHHN